MKLWQACYMDDEEGRMLFWATSKKGVLKLVADQCEDIDKISLILDPINFPTKKSDIVRWLNVNLNRNNG